MNSQDMHAFYRQHARACSARISVVGNAQRPQVQAWAGRLMGAWQPHGCSVFDAIPALPPPEHAQAIRMPFESAQAHIWVGHVGVARSDPDFFPLMVGNHILGGSGFSSRLMQEAREKRGLTYGVHSFFVPHAHAGVFGVTMQTRPEQAQQALALIESEITQFVAHGPEPAALEQAQQSLVQSFVLRIDTNQKLLMQLANILWNDLPLNYLETWTQQVQAVSAEQVQAAFARMVQPQRLVSVVVGGAP